MVRYGSLVEGKLSASLLSPFLCISRSKIDQENDDKDINDDGGDKKDSDGGDYDDDVVMMAMVMMAIKIMMITIGRLSPSLHKQD